MNALNLVARTPTTSFSQERFGIVKDDTCGAPFLGNLGAKEASGNLLLMSTSHSHFTEYTH